MNTSRNSPCGLVTALGTLLLVATWHAAAVAQTPHDELARRILDATGTTAGLVVHLDCGDGRLTAALAAESGRLVEGIGHDRATLESAQRLIRSRGLARRVAFRHALGRSLPYVDNLVNLIVSERPLTVPADEVRRVLAPGGVAYVKSADGWTETVEPWPVEIDQWTHYLHDATGNAVAADSRVGPPRHMQWQATPTWARNHHTLASISAVVTAAGRLYYIVDDGPAGSLDVPPRWSLVARDAFNGVELWRRPIESWAYHRHKFRSGPVQLPRTLVADANRVYLPLAASAPLCELDAATGRIVRTFDRTDGTEEVILADGVLLAVSGRPASEQSLVGPGAKRPANKRAGKKPGNAPRPNVREKRITAIRAASGETLWSHTPEEEAPLVPVTLAADDGRAVFQSGGGATCLELETGRTLWQWRPAGGQSRLNRAIGAADSTLVVNDGVVLRCDGKNLAALSLDNGKLLWQCGASLGFRSPADVFVIDGIVWLGPAFREGRDLHTGEVAKTNDVLARLITVGHHHRCYREKATERFILAGKRGIEFVDLAGEDHSRNNWVRGACQYGIMPANGLVYAPSHACGCFMEAKLYGFWALAATRAAPAPIEPATRREKGPAFGQIAAASVETDDDGDWPTLRHDARRGGTTEAEAPDRLDTLWTAVIGDRPSAPVVAGGLVIAAALDARRVVALDADTGKEAWTYHAGGRVDSPPTVHGGLVLFGAADGCIYCVRLADGRLVWRFHAAPHRLMTVALGQVESLWPVHGNILVQEGVAYFAVGRQSYLDGGLLLFGLDAATGEVAFSTRIATGHPGLADGRDHGDGTVKKFVQNATDHKTFDAPDRSDAFSMEGTTNDVLVGDGRSIFLRNMKFDAAGIRQAASSRHLFSTSSLLDDAEVHRSHWMLGSGDFSRTPVAYSWIANGTGKWGSQFQVPLGLILTFDDETIWGVRRVKDGTYGLFSQPNQKPAEQESSLPDCRPNGNAEKLEKTWTVPLAMRPRALIRAGSRLFIGGMPNAADPAAFEGAAGGTLWTVSPIDGTIVARTELPAPPVWDGLAATPGRLFVATTDGKIHCLGKGP